MTALAEMIEGNIRQMIGDATPFSKHRQTLTISYRHTKSVIQ